MQVSQLLVPHGGSPRKAQANPADDAVEADRAAHEMALHDGSDLPMSPIMHEATLGSGLLDTGIHDVDIELNSPHGAGLPARKVAEEPAGASQAQASNPPPAQNSQGELRGAHPGGVATPEELHECLFNVGPYAVTRFIAAGGFAKVYEAVREGFVVALKIEPFTAPVVLRDDVVPQVTNVQIGTTAPVLLNVRQNPCTLPIFIDHTA